jgi:hypothetical protein
VPMMCLLPTAWLGVDQLLCCCKDGSRQVQLRTCCFTNSGPRSCGHPRFTTASRRCGSMPALPSSAYCPSAAMATDASITWFIALPRTQRY